MTTSSKSGPPQEVGISSANRGVPKQKGVGVPRKSSNTAKGGAASVSQPPAGAPRQTSGACRGVPRQRQVRSCSTIRSTTKPVPTAPKPTSQISEDVMSAPCRKCGKKFKRLPTHLSQKLECMAMYPEFNKEERRKQQKREYQKRWNAEHPEEARERNREKQKRWNAKHPEEAR